MSAAIRGTYRLAAVLAALAMASGCVGGRVVFGNIPPSTFEFTTVVEHDGVGSGGWQVAQIVVLLGQLSPMFPRTSVCNVEVGLPSVHHRLGTIFKPRAQRASARASDRAARELLSERKRPTASACRLFHARMQEILRLEISGAKVTNFRSWPGKSVPRRTFPPKRGR